MSSCFTFLFDKWNILCILHALYDQNEIVKQLIAQGADLNALDATLSTPLDRAKRRPLTAAILRKHGGKTGEELKAEGK